MRAMRALKESRRYWLPVAAAALCLLAASFGPPPLVAYVLIMGAFGTDQAVALARGAAGPELTFKAGELYVGT